MLVLSVAAADFNLIRETNMPADWNTANAPQHIRHSDERRNLVQKKTVAGFRRSPE
jgi:hypothetical protein